MFINQQAHSHRQASTVYPTRAGAFPPASFFDSSAEYAYIRMVQEHYHGSFGICVCPAASYATHHADVRS